MNGTFTVAMTGATDALLSGHLLRADGQEDVCLATYQRSTSATRTNVILGDVILPEPGERTLHGNASFNGSYVLRAATIAAEAGGGIALLHSHPMSRNWQRMSAADADAEAGYALLALEITDLPLVGMTLAGDGTWSARRWSRDGQHRWAEAVRIVDAQLTMSYNDELRPPLAVTGAQARTVSAWGKAMHLDITRLRVLIVGLGSVGLDVALRLAATGIATIGLMDFDVVEWLNLDRLIGATALDALLGTPKVDVAARLLTQAATAPEVTINRHNMSICEPDGLAAALGYDVIISCVDRPWPRGVLNSVAYSDLIPVIDGGIHIDAFADADGGGMRSCTWRTHVLRPGRPCLACNGQLDPSMVPLDRDGLLDDPAYIAAAGLPVRARQNVAALSASVSASLLAQLVSLLAAPGGIGEPGPLRYLLATHTLDSVACTTSLGCGFEGATGAGDHRPALVGHHDAAHFAVPRPGVRRSLLGALGRATHLAIRVLDRQAKALLEPRER